MFKRIYLLAFLPLLLVSCSGRMIERCIWQEKPLYADGLKAAWPIPIYFNNSTMLSFSVSNDQKNLYLCFKTTDELIQMRILRAGMQVWIDTTSRKKNKLGILYPIQNARKQMPPPLQHPTKDNKPDKSFIKKRFIEENQSLKLIGFKKCNAMPVRLTDQECLSLRMDIDSNNTLTYRMVIPFASFYKDKLSAIDSNHVFNFNVVVNGLAIDQVGESWQGEGKPEGAPDGMPPGKPPMGKNNPGGYGGHGGPGGMQPPDGMGDMTSQNEETSFNIKFRLSVR